MAGADVWKECLIWFRNCGVNLPDNFPPTDNIDSFSRYLRDGVLLCHLVHLLKPNAMDLPFDCVQPENNNEGQYLQNINTFLYRCQMDFGLEDSDLFEPEMLCNLTNFDRVLYTLSQLSKSSKIVELGITGFSAAASPSPNCLSWELSSDTRDEPGAIYELDDEAMRFSIVSDFQKNVNSRPEVLPADPIARGIHKILVSERNYIKELKNMEEYVMEPLSKVLNTHQKSVLFYAIKEFIQIHQQMEHELKTAAGPDKKDTKMYIVFLNWKEKLNIYQKYGANLPIALDLVAKEVELIETNMKRRFKLTQFLLQPIHHCCSYGVLLKELRKKIPKTHEDYGGLKFAGKAMSDLAEHVNAVIQDSFILQTLEHVQASICDWKPEKNEKKPSLALGEFGRLFRQGFLRVSFSELKSEDQKDKFYVFLFSRTVIFCTPKSRSIPILGSISRREQYSFKFRVVLSNAILEERIGLNDLDQEQIIPWSHSWRIMGPTGMTNITFYTKTAEERRRWVESFKSVVSRLHPSLDMDSDAATHTFELQTFSSAVNCHVCRKLLKGLLEQGYQCKKCDYAFHRQCLEFSKQCRTDDEEIYCTVIDLDSIAQEFSIPLEQSVTALPESSAPSNLLETQPWFGGSMSAEEATRTLHERLPGTFIVRSRNADTPDAFTAPFALSVRMNDGVKHVKVQCFRTLPEENHYVVQPITTEFYLIRDLTFPTINDLVDWYTNHFLSEAFPQLANVYLEKPFKLA